MRGEMTTMEMGLEATVDTQKLVSASEGLFPEHRYRPQDIEANYCKCTGLGCLTLSCPCFSAAFLCSETCSCQVCGNAPDIKPGIEMTLEEIDSKYPLPNFLKDAVCTCEKDGCAKLCTGCLMSCQYYASLNPFEKKEIHVQSPIESANSSLTFDSKVDGMKQRLRILKQQIGSTNAVAFDQSVETLPQLSQLPLQQHITTYTSPCPSSPSMVGNPSFPQCSSQQLNPAHPLSINQTVQRMQEFSLIPEQQKINSVFPQSFNQQIKPLAFNQTVPNMPGLNHFACQQNIKTFNPPRTSDSDHFDAKSYYKELCQRKKLSHRGKSKKPSKVSLNGCLCQMFSCAQRNCKCLKYGVSCSDQCRCANCQNPHGRRNGVEIH